MSVQNPNRVVTKQDLADFYGDILPYLGGMPEVLANKFSKGDMYSTDEKMIGQWIDGKPVYQKTVNFGALPNKTIKAVSAGISNLDYLISMEALGFSSGHGIPIPNANPEATGDAIYMDLDNGFIRVYTNSDKSSFTNCYVTLKYTKTTDSAVSIGNDTDYSTTEKIVGTWIDGKPIWQKTWNNLGIALVNDSWTDTVTLTGADTIISAFGTCTYSNNTYSDSFGTRRVSGSYVVKIMNESMYGNTLNTLTLQYTKTSS